jgi:hypothetical protein
MRFNWPAHNTHVFNLINVRPVIRISPGIGSPCAAKPNTYRPERAKLELFVLDLRYLSRVGADRRARSLARSLGFKPERDGIDSRNAFPANLNPDPAG